MLYVLCLDLKNKDTKFVVQEINQSREHVAKANATDPKVHFKLLFCACFWIIVLLRALLSSVLQVQKAQLRSTSQVQKFNFLGAVFMIKVANAKIEQFARSVHGGKAHKCKRPFNFLPPDYMPCIFRKPGETTDSLNA